MSIPEKQSAVQLIGPDELKLNKSKPVDQPGPHQILCEVEAVGLCFSDLKLLKQFSSHIRKSVIVSGVDDDVLEGFPAYVPGEAPTVPGHETVVRIAAVGEGVTGFSAGERYLVQTDYRWLKTAGANAAFGYNIEGALQEYVLMDERIITSFEGEVMMIPVPEDISASAVALVEPWACVEDSYVSKERTGLKEGGTMMVVADDTWAPAGMRDLVNEYGRPGRMIWISDSVEPDGLDAEHSGSIEDVDNESCDDIIYFGSCAETIEKLFSKLAAKGLLNIVLGGGRLSRDIITPVGRIHYSGIRIVGTPGRDPCESMKRIPATGEIREDDIVNVVGAGGPMGMMHVVRNVCQGVSGVSVFAGDVSDERLDELRKIVNPLAEKNGVLFRAYNPGAEDTGEEFTYVAIMVPSPALVGASIGTIGNGAIINIFAGIPVDVTGEIDIRRYIDKGAYFIGTSGSTLEDMHIVLEKVKSGQLDTNLSVAAVCGLDGAIDGIRAVEGRTIPGKIIVYPSRGGLGLVRLMDMTTAMPEVAEKLVDGLWSHDAEKELVC